MADGGFLPSNVSFFLWCLCHYISWFNAKKVDYKFFWHSETYSILTIIDIFQTNGIVLGCYAEYFMYYTPPQFDHTNMQQYSYKHVFYKQNGIQCRSWSGGFAIEVSWSGSTVCWKKDQSGFSRTRVKLKYRIWAIKHTAYSFFRLLGPPPDGFFYPTLTLMLDAYCLQ